MTLEFITERSYADSHNLPEDIDMIVRTIEQVLTPSTLVDIYAIPDQVFVKTLNPGGEPLLSIFRADHVDGYCWRSVSENDKDWRETDIDLLTLVYSFQSYSAFKADESLNEDIAQNYRPDPDLTEMMRLAHSAGVKISAYDPALFDDNEAVDAGEITLMYGMNNQHSSVVQVKVLKGGAFAMRSLTYGTDWHHSGIGPKAAAKELKAHYEMLHAETEFRQSAPRPVIPNGVVRGDTTQPIIGRLSNLRAFIESHDEIHSRFSMVRNLIG